MTQINAFTPQTTSTTTCIQFSQYWTNYNNWVLYSGSIGWCRAIPSYAYHICTSDALQPCSYGNFWGTQADSCQVAMCPPGAERSPSSNGPDYNDPYYYSDTPSCPCVCPSNTIWTGTQCIGTSAPTSAPTSPSVTSVYSSGQ